MKQQADFTKRRAVDLCRVAACLCRMRWPRRVGCFR